MIFGAVLIIAFLFLIFIIVAVCIILAIGFIDFVIEMWQDSTIKKIVGRKKTKKQKDGGLDE